jgi:chromosome partitioning protein
MMIVAIINQKCGEGKISTAVNLSAAMAALGRRSLLVDLDSQASLGVSLGIHVTSPTVFDLLTGRNTAAEAMIRQKDFDLILSSEDLASAVQKLSDKPDWELILRKALDPIADDYAFVYLDCPPGQGLLTINALAAASKVYIPIQPEFSSIDELKNLLDVIADIKKRFNPKLEIAGIIVTREDHQIRTNSDIDELLRIHSNGILLKQRVRENVSIEEFLTTGKDGLTFKPNSDGASEYLALADEILMREG